MIIKLDKNKIDFENGNIYGYFHFKTNDFVFPSEDWNDFVVVVFNWWSKALINLLENTTLNESLDFMDGSFSIKINYLEDNFFKMLFFDGEELIKKDRVNALDFTKQFLQQVNYLLRITENFDTNSKDIIDLKHQFIVLQKIINNKRKNTTNSC